VLAAIVATVSGRSEIAEIGNVSAMKVMGLQEMKGGGGEFEMMLTRHNKCRR